MIYIISASIPRIRPRQGSLRTPWARVFEWIMGEKRHARQEEFRPRRVLQELCRLLYTIPWDKYPFSRKSSTALWRSPAPTPEHTCAAGSATFSRSARKYFVKSALCLAPDPNALEPPVGTTKPRDIMSARRYACRPQVLGKGARASADSRALNAHGMVQGAAPYKAQLPENPCKPPWIRGFGGLRKSAGAHHDIFHHGRLRPIAKLATRAATELFLADWMPARFFAGPA